MAKNDKQIESDEPDRTLDDLYRTSLQADKEAAEILKGCPVGLDYYVCVWIEQRIAVCLQPRIDDGKRLDWLEQQGWPLKQWLDDYFFEAESIREAIDAAKRAMEARND